MEFVEVIKNRCATRKFSNTKPTRELINQVLEAGRIAPTAKNNQPERIYIIETEESLRKLDEATPCRYNAPVVLMVCANKAEAFTKGDHSSYEMDASIVATHLMLMATNLGLDNIWIEMFDREKLISLFSLEENIEPVCLIPIGYKAEDCPESINHHNRKALTEIVKYI